MITQNAVPAYIEENIPEISLDVKKLASAANTIYLSVRCLTDFTHRMVKEHNYNMIRRCFAVAAKLHAKGNDTVKNVLESVYVHSLSSLFSNCETPRERNLVQAALPGGLHRIYVQQILKSGI